MSLLVFLASLTYYGLLSARDYTFLFVSQDSGDWLAASSWWYAPQPLGSPLYILSGHFLNLFGGSLPMKMTLVLSALPSAITVMLVYLIVSGKTGKKVYGLVASLVLLGASVFLSQSTILEEYALATMFMVLAYYCYMLKKPKLVLLALSLGTCVHIIVLLVTVLWWIVERKQWKAWLWVSWVYVLPVVVFYSLIPVLMATGVPLIGGKLSFHGLWQYVTETPSAVGYNITLLDFPKRVGVFLSLLVMSLGLAWIPVVLGLKSLERWKWIAVATAVFAMTYYLFSLDPSTWAFLVFGLPFLAILAGVGLARLSRWQLQAVVTVALALVVLNGVFLNASTLARAEPTASTVEQEFMVLPQDSAVIVMAGHYSFALFYAMSQGRADLTPIVWKEALNEFPKESELTSAYLDYCAYYSDRIVSVLPIDRVREAWDKGMPLYIADAEWGYTLGKNPPWNTLVKDVLVLEGSGRIRKVVGFREVSSLQQ